MGVPGFFGAAGKLIARGESSAIVISGTDAPIIQIMSHFMDLAVRNGCQSRSDGKNTEACMTEARMPRA
ncbi:MAG: hypothetical protein CMN76_18750 [Spirochaetaceae bacterium]|nr:hypothetical protein [Spirochaetaceae bacterium]